MNKELEKYNKIGEYDDVFENNHEKMMAITHLINLLKKEKNGMGLYFISKELKDLFDVVRISEPDYLELMNFTKKIKNATYKEMVLFLKDYLKKYPNTAFNHPITKNKIINFIGDNYEVQSIIRGYKTKITRKSFKKLLEEEIPEIPLNKFITEELEKLK